MWLKVSGTCFRSNGFGPASLDYTAMFKVADIHHVDVTPCTFSKIQALERFTVQQQHEDASDDQDGRHSAGAP